MNLLHYRFFLLSLLIGACQSQEHDQENDNRLFALLPFSHTGITFSNTVTYNEEFNPYTFRNFFNGGGVAIGDVNNDSLPDIFFCSNQQSNKLYLNKGDFVFEDITEQAGLNSEGVWSTGVSMADVNGDGLLDIYVTKSGDFKSRNRSNSLYINNGASPSPGGEGRVEVTFTERSKEYGLNNMGLSTHAVFFDFDNDADLDCYLLNNSFRSVGNYDLVKDQRNIIDTAGGNKFYRNDSNHFVDITQRAGIYSSKIGFGLGVTISDIDLDGWQDIYVSNDFFERDYLYINQHNGTFKESLENYISEISLNSMGADIADINNDGFPEIYVTDMFPEQNDRVKTKTNFENWDKYQSNLKNGYYKQFVRNTLQLNSGFAKEPADLNKVHFSEISRMANVSATDWSWGALIADLDNDGWKDIFVANGIYKDVTDQDYIQYAANATASIKEKILNREKNIIKNLVDIIPSNPISNYLFSNNGDLTFTNRSKEWGLDAPGFSNGSAYGDLDNDGDLDLVVNNVNMPCFVYRNQSIQQHPENKYLKVILEGEGQNRFGLGAKVTVHYNYRIAYQEEMPMRGFESSVDSRLNFGLGKTENIDSVEVQWNGGNRQVIRNVKPNQTLTVKQSESTLNPQPVTLNPQPVTRNPQPPTRNPQPVTRNPPPPTRNPQPATRNPLFRETTDNYGLDFVHKENDFVDFDRDKLTFQMLSTEGPRMAKGDVNADGLEDLYICGAKDQPGALYIQSQNGKFKRSNEKLLEQDKGSEDTDCIFFDADTDGDSDLFVCSGGNEFSPNSTDLISRLYINDGKGRFTKSPQILPSAVIFEASSCVSSADYDGDGDQDLFVGVRVKPFSYGYACKGYILQNNGKGVFTDVTSKVAPALEQAGMITDGKWFDYDRDGRADLVIAGEYMPVRIFHNENKALKEVTGGLQKSNGWWNRLVIADINADGYDDIIGGNHGLNSRFKASEAKPVCMYVSDFDDNGSVEQVICCYNGDSSYPMALRHDLVNVLPYLKKKYLKYESYKNQTITDVFSREQLRKAVKLNAYEMRSSVFVNNRNGTFTKSALPAEAQLSPVYGIVVKDFDGDGKADILLGGNLYESKPEAGIYDASYGQLLKGDGKGGFTAIHTQQSGVNIKGAVRDIITVKSRKQTLTIVAKNNAKINIFKDNEPDK